MTQSPFKSFFAWLYLVIASFLYVEASAGQSVEHKAYRFDAGDEGGLAEQSMALPADMNYTMERGYGWLEEGHNYARNELNKSRDELLRDGVYGEQLAFRIDVPPGQWRVFFWAEAGIQDESTLTYKVNGESSRLIWQSFNPPAEPRTIDQPNYRLHQQRVTVGDEGIELEWRNEADRVAIQAILVTPEPESATRLQEALEYRLYEVGSYPVQRSGELADIASHLSSMYEVDASDAFNAYWYTQLHILMEAERIFLDLRGWEWANELTGMSLFQRLHQSVMLFDGVLADARPTDPLYERALWQRGRLLYWLNKERGGPGEAEAAERDLTAMYERFPADTLVAMYNDQKIDVDDACDLPENFTYSFPEAPKWAIEQHETLCRLRYVVHWWVEEQQAPNGELGGKIGDDVEMLRGWSPLAMVGDTVVQRGWALLADAAFTSPKIEKGYFKAAVDVEHASEPISDTAPALSLFSDDPLYVDRLSYSARYFVERWTQINEYGRRFFRSAWFGSEAIDERPPRNRDLEMNTRAVKAVRYYAQITRDPEVIRALHEWSQSWVHVAMQTDKGKPKGIMPASVRGSDEAINGDEPTWYEANMFWSYFDWTHNAGTMLYDQLLFTYTLTGDTSLLSPLFLATDLVAEYLKNPDPNPTEGSSTWAASVLSTTSDFWGVLGMWRTLTGDERYDDLLKEYGTPYLRYRLTGDESHLAKIMEPFTEQLRYNVPLFTTEALHTDRVYVSGRGARSSGPANLKAMLTGGGSAEDSSPYMAVTWENSPEEITILVDQTGPDRVAMQVFLFDDDEANLTMRTWQLAKGKYILSVSDTDREYLSKELVIDEPGERIDLVLPAQRLIRVQLLAKNDVSTESNKPKQGQWGN